MIIPSKLYIGDNFANYHLIEDKHEYRSYIQLFRFYDIISIMRYDKHVLHRR